MEFVASSQRTLSRLLLTRQQLQDLIRLRDAILAKNDEDVASLLLVGTFVRVKKHKSYIVRLVSAVETGKDASISLRLKGVAGPVNPLGVSSVNPFLPSTTDPAPDSHPELDDLLDVLDPTEPALLLMKAAATAWRLKVALQWAENLDDWLTNHGLPTLMTSLHSPAKIAVMADHLERRAGAHLSPSHPAWELQRPQPLQEQQKNWQGQGEVTLWAPAATAAAPAVEAGQQQLHGDARGGPAVSAAAPVPACPGVTCPQPGYEAAGAAAAEGAGQGAAGWHTLAQPNKENSGRSSPPPPPPPQDISPPSSTATLLRQQSGVGSQQLEAQGVVAVWAPPLPPEAPAPLPPILAGPRGLAGLSAVSEVTLKAAEAAAQAAYLLVLSQAAQGRAGVVPPMTHTPFTSMHRQDHSLLLQSGLGEQSTFPELTSSGGAAAEDEQGVNTQRPEAAKLAAAAPAVADGRSGQPAREAMRDKAPYFVDGTGTARQLSEVEELPACKELGSPSWGRGRSHGRIGHKRRHRSSSSPHSRSDSGSGRRRRHRGDSRPRGRSDSRGGHRHRHRGDSSPRGRSDSHSRHRHRYTGNSSPRSRGDSPRRLDHTSRHRDSSCRSKSPRNSADSQEQRRTRGSSVSPSREAAADAPMWVNGVLLDYRLQRLLIQGLQSCRRKLGTSFNVGHVCNAMITIDRSFVPKRDMPCEFGELCVELERRGVLELSNGHAGLLISRLHI